MSMKFHFSILFLLGSVVSFAQSSHLFKGEVLDQTDSFSLPGATLRLEPGNRYTVSDGSGNFEFLNVPDGSYTLSVIYMGYQDYEQPIEVNGAQEQVVISLIPQAQHIGEVTVMGDILRGQAKALNQQKNNSNISNIISSDQVGRFPDQNIGDALKRVPGITMQNDQGEARNIIMRGLSPELNSVTLNGDRIPSAEGDNRNVQMDLIPADMISSIEVNKTLTPDMDADAIGGSVNLITRAVPNRQRISATLGGGFMPIREKPVYNASLVYGNRFAKNKLGVVLSGTLQGQNYGSDNIEAVWDEDDAGRAFIEEMNVRKYDVQRIRRGLSLAADYEINSRNRIGFNALYNWRDDRENRYAAIYKDMEWDEAQQSYVGTISREDKAGIDNNANKGGRLERQTIMNYALNGEHLLSPKLDFDWSVSYSKASEEKPNERYIEYEQEDVLLDQDVRDPYRPFVRDHYTDYSKFNLATLTESDGFTSEDEIGAKVNFRFPLSVIPDQKGRFRFGGRLRIKNKIRDNDFFEYAPLNGLETMDDAKLVSWSDPLTQGSHYIPGSFVDKKFVGGLDLRNPNLFESEDDPSEYLAENYEASERITAAYVRWDQNFSARTSMIVGVRLEHTHIDYSGNYVQDEEELIGKVNNKNSYFNILPGLTFRHDVTKDFILRAAVTTSLARPNYYYLAPYVSAIPDDNEIEAGNPNLKATYAANVDLMAEYYFKNVGILSGGLFYKRLYNFIYRYSDNDFTSAEFAEAFPDIKNPIPEHTSDQWSFIQSRNGDNVDVYGLEVAFQRQLDFLPGKFLKGFGVYLNYTYTHSVAKGITNDDGEAREGLGLPRTAPHMLNASLSWENPRFSARISANYTSAYLDEIAGEAFDDAYYDQQFFLDLNLAYKIGKQWRIFAEANNLTNQPLRYYQGTRAHTMQLEYYRQRFNIGVKFDL